MKRLEWVLVLIRVLLLGFMLWSSVGCSAADPDQRLTQLTSQVVHDQSEQNQRLAEQTRAVVEQSGQLAEAARDLVEQDAQARRELIAAGERMTARIDADRSQLEVDRREVARQRLREPLVAEAIRSTGILLACLAPLVITFLVLRPLSSSEPDHAAVADLLVQELTADQPVLLPAPVLRRLPSPEEPSHPALPFDPADDLPPY